MANTVRLPYSNTATNTPSSLGNGVLAINQADGKLYYRNSSGVVTQLATASGSDPVTLTVSQISDLAAGNNAAARMFLWQTFR